MFITFSLSWNHHENDGANPTKSSWNEEDGNKKIFLATGKQAEESFLAWPILKHQILNMKCKWVAGSGLGDDLVCTDKIWGHSIWVDAYD